MLAPPERSGRHRLLAVGRLHRHKGFDLLIRAFAGIADYFPDWDLVILGEGSERDVLQSQIHAAGLSERISLPGRAGNVEIGRAHVRTPVTNAYLVCRLLL